MEKKSTIVFLKTQLQYSVISMLYRVMGKILLLSLSVVLFTSLGINLPSLVTYTQKTF
jgi:hypothetical protein